MEKTILQDYVDACELIKDTEKDIRKLNQKRNAVIFKIQGNTSAGEEDSRLRHEEKLLEQRKAGAEQIKWQGEEWMVTLSARMQRIVKYRYLEALSWEEVAVRMGRNATADSVRKELKRFFEEN